MSQHVARPTHTRTTSDTRSTWASGWAGFAAIMMAITGLWWMMSGLVAIVNDEFFVATQDYLFKFDVSTWGWIHLVLGVGIAAAGLALPTGATWARFTGIVMASLALVAAFAWMPWYPIWGIVFMVAAAMSIWALTVPGEYLTADF